MIENKLLTRMNIFIIALILIFILVDLPTSYAQNGPPAGMEPTNTIQVLNITFSDDTPMEGEDIIISTYIKNNSPKPIANITVSFLLNNQEVIKNVTDISLGTNESKLIEHEWTTEKGQQNIGVMLYVDGNLIQSPLVNENIYVEQEPLGDIGTLVLAILAIFIFIFILVILPSIWSAIRPEIEPYAHWKNSQKPNPPKNLQ